MAKFTWAAFARLDADSQLKPFELEHRAPDGKPVPCPSIFSEPTKDLTVVIPAYNEEDRLPATLQETLR